MYLNSKMDAFISTPPSLARKHCCVNIQSDGHSFLLSVICCLRWQTSGPFVHPERVCSYLQSPKRGKRKRDWKPDFDTIGLETEMLGSSVQPADIQAFEEANELGVYLYEWKERQLSSRPEAVFLPFLQRSPQTIYPREVVLVRLEDNGRQHFLACTNFRALKGLCHGPKHHSAGHSFDYCHRCCRRFRVEVKLTEHLAKQDCLGTSLEEHYYSFLT